MRYVLPLLMFVAVLLISPGCETSASAQDDPPEPVEAPEPAPNPGDRIQLEYEARLAARRAALAVEAEAERESRDLAAAMERYVTYVLCDLPKERGGECRVNADHARELAERRDLLGFAQLLQTVVEARDRAGLWVPLGRENAPPWLAAVAYHEYSWRWKETTLRGGIGERCAFQLAGGAINRWRVRRNASLPLVLSPETIRAERMTKRGAETRVTRRPRDCAEAAIEWMEHSAQKCGGGDETEFLEMGDDGEPRRRWTRVKVPVSNPGATQWEWGSKLMVVPTEAAQWMGAYATPGICGGARAIVTERFETAYHIKRFMRERGGEHAGTEQAARDPNRPPRPLDGA